MRNVKFHALRVCPVTRFQSGHTTFSDGRIAEGGGGSFDATAGRETGLISIYYIYIYPWNLSGTLTLSPVAVDEFDQGVLSSLNWSWSLVPLQRPLT